MVEKAKNFEDYLTVRIDEVTFNPTPASHLVYPHIFGRVKYVGEPFDFAQALEKALGLREVQTCFGILTRIQGKDYNPRELLFFCHQPILFDYPFPWRVKDSPQTLDISIETELPDSVNIEDDEGLRQASLYLNGNFSASSGMVWYDHDLYRLHWEAATLTFYGRTLRPLKYPVTPFSSQAVRAGPT